LATSSNGSFTGCTSLERASLPALTSIGNLEFSNCTALRVLEIPYSAGLVTSIGSATTPFTNVRIKNLIDSSGTGSTNASSLLSALQSAGMAVFTNYVLNYW
jgi:hypothetical protein